MADEIGRQVDYLARSHKACKATLESLDSMLKACESATPAPGGGMQALLAEWRQALEHQRLRLDEAHAASLASLHGGQQLSDTAPLSVELDSLKWSRLFEVLLASYQADPQPRPHLRDNRNGPPPKQKRAIEHDAEFDAELCDVASDDWASADLASLSSSDSSNSSNFEQVDVEQAPVAPSGDNCPLASSDKENLARTGKVAPADHDLKFVRDRIMARFQLHQRFGHHLSRDTVTEVMRRGVERDAQFVTRPLPHIYEAVKHLLPVALESAKSKYQAPHVSPKLLAQWTFKTKLCLPFLVNGGRCPNGDQCPYAHGEAELRPKRRVALCHQWEERGFCQRRAVCLYAHGRAELGQQVR